MGGPEPSAAAASATRELFIDMLTRDIGLIPAIVDLVDNSVDGARRQRGDSSLDGLWVRLEISPKQLRVADNCGGMDVPLARKYAFRFGRPDSAPFIPHSIGRFGVGMKRAFFKIGRRFQVESTAETSRFTMDIDVEEWAAEDRKEEEEGTGRPWRFPFDSVEEGLKPIPADARGTIVTVTRLHDDVADSFGQRLFEKRLEGEIASRLQPAIASGLAITLNKIPVGGRPLEVLDHPDLRPAGRECAYGKGRHRVTVKLYCGLGAGEPGMAGWHVFCNGRLVLRADKSAVTGWGERREVNIPAFHPQYNQFRGYAYFDSDDAGRLPWNTTKTGLDTDSPVYRAAALEMMVLMRPVIDFLNRLKEEKEGKGDPEEKGPLESLVESAESKPMDNVSTRAAFEMPKVKVRKKPKGPVMQRIQYDKPLEQVDRVKKVLHITTFKEVGEKTFEYFFDAECEE